MTDRLRFASDGAEPGALAMARDVVLAGSAASPDAGTVVRFHDWDGPCVSFGRGQDAATRGAEDLVRLGIAAVRRPTGGGWLLHLPGDLAVTLACAAPASPGSLRAAARRVADAIARGLSAIGIDASLTGGEVLPGQATRADVCFARNDPDEVESRGVKLAGVALGRVRRAILVQSAIPLVPASRELAEVAAAWDARRAAAARRVAGVDRERLTRAITDAFSSARTEPAAWNWTSELEREAAALAEEMGAGRP